MDVQALDVDYLTVAGHKFYGPRAGALYVRGLEEKATPLFPILFGGGQERGFRPGSVARLSLLQRIILTSAGNFSAHAKWECLLFIFL